MCIVHAVRLGMDWRNACPVGTIFVGHSVGHLRRFFYAVKVIKVVQEMAFLMNLCDSLFCLVTIHLML